MTQPPSQEPSATSREAEGDGDEGTDAQALHHAAVNPLLRANASALPERTFNAPLHAPKPSMIVAGLYSEELRGIVRRRLGLGVALAAAGMYFFGLPHHELSPDGANTVVALRPRFASYYAHNIVVYRFPDHLRVFHTSSPRTAAASTNSAADRPPPARRSIAADPINRGLDRGLEGPTQFGYGPVPMIPTGDPAGHSSSRTDPAPDGTRGHSTAVAPSNGFAGAAWRSFRGLFPSTLRHGTVVYTQGRKIQYNRLMYRLVPFSEPHQSVLSDVAAPEDNRSEAEMVCRFTYRHEVLPAKAWGHVQGEGQSRLEWVGRDVLHQWIRSMSSDTLQSMPRSSNDASDETVKVVSRRLTEEMQRRLNSRVIVEDVAWALTVSESKAERELREAEMSSRWQW